MQISLIIIFSTGILFSILAIPLMKRKVKMNNWYGIRIPQTMEDENVWYEVNAAMGKYIFSWGIFISVLSLYFFLNPTSPGYLMIYVLIGVMIAGAILLVILSYKIADKVRLKDYNNNGS